LARAAAASAIATAASWLRTRSRRGPRRSVRIPDGMMRTIEGTNTAMYSTPTSVAEPAPLIADQNSAVSNDHRPASTIVAARTRSRYAGTRSTSVSRTSRARASPASRGPRGRADADRSLGRLTSRRSGVGGAATLALELALTDEIGNLGQVGQVAVHVRLMAG